MDAPHGRAIRVAMVLTRVRPRPWRAPVRSTAEPKCRSHGSDSAIGKSFAAKANANQRKSAAIDSLSPTILNPFACICVDLRLNLL
ncbi:MAG: hypothetical protein [Olavius algarvensis Gamma 1 endosymbiont]|nr:MAG: hypothetical protein [Olavius algarvensis Gamma 1 endosymbiont]